MDQSDQPDFEAIGALLAGRHEEVQNLYGREDCPGTEPEAIWCSLRVLSLDQGETMELLGVGGRLMLAELACRSGWLACFAWDGFEWSPGAPGVAGSASWPAGGDACALADFSNLDSFWLSSFLGALERDKWAPIAWSPLNGSQGIDGAVRSLHGKFRGAGVGELVSATDVERLVQSIGKPDWDGELLAAFPQLRAIEEGRELGACVDAPARSAGSRSRSL